MLLKINGEMKTFEHSLSVAELIKELGYDTAHIAVAIDTTFVPRSNYEQVIIEDSCEIDIVAPMQGG